MLFARLFTLLIRSVAVDGAQQDTNCWLVIIMTSFLLLSRDARNTDNTCTHVFTYVLLRLSLALPLSLFYTCGKSLSKQINSSSRFPQWLKHCGACCSALLHFSFFAFVSSLFSLSLSFTTLTLTLAILKLLLLSLPLGLFDFYFARFLFFLLVFFLAFFPCVIYVHVFYYGVCERERGSRSGMKNASKSLV